jgi:hypothetical protein
VAFWMGGLGSGMGFDDLGKEKAAQSPVRLARMR